MSLLQAVLASRPQGSPTPQDPFQQTAMQKVGVTNPLVQQLGGNLMGLLGDDPRSKQDQMTDRLSSLDLGTISGKEKAAEIYGSFGLQKNALAMSESAKADRLKLQDRQRMDDLYLKAAKQAREFGDNELADLIATNTLPEKEVMDRLKDARTTFALRKNGLPAVNQVIAQYGFTPEDFTIEQKQQMAADPENTSKMFDLLEADTKGYVDSEGNEYALRTSRSGRIEDPNNPGVFKTANELGLISAPNRNTTLSLLDNSVRMGVDFLESKDFSQANEVGIQAREGLIRTQTSKDLLKEGINTGLLGPLKTMYADVQLAFGSIGEGDPVAQQAARSRLFESGRLDDIAQYLEAFKPASNTDLDLVRELKANKTFSKAAWEKLLDIEEKWYERGIKAHNKVLDRTIALGKNDENLKNAVEIYRLEPLGGSILEDPDVQSYYGEASNLPEGP
jgi:hypothetical protein